MYVVDAGFTGTPIESGDRSTPAVFGDYIDVYDILRAVEDGATVRIYCEGRLAKIELDENEITPIGYMHPTCVRHVLEGQTVLGDGRIQYADGSVEASAPVCDYPRYSPQGVLATRNEPTRTAGWSMPLPQPTARTTS